MRSFIMKSLIMSEYEQEFETLKFNITTATQKYLHSLKQLSFAQFHETSSYIKHLHVRNGMVDTEIDLSTFRTSSILRNSETAPF